MVFQPFHVSCFTLKFLAVLIVDVGHALRSNNLHILQEANECPEICKAWGSPGYYTVEGDAGRRINHRIQPGAKFFAAGSCTEPLANASLVPWIPPEEDPITASFIAVYTDPLLPHLLGTGTAKLCADTNGKIDCLCKLTGHQPLGVLGSLASVLPASNGLVQLQLAMQRRCPAGVPDAMAVILLVLLLLVVVLWAEAAWSWKIPDPEEEKNAVWPEEVVRLKSAFQNFRTGFGWFSGFVMSLATLQTVALVVVTKSTETEVAVWFVAAAPAVLSFAAAFFFGFLLCKQQLTHACLQHGHVLADPPKIQYLHKLLFTLLLLYTLVTVILAGLPLAALAIPALAGPCWTLVKAVNVGGEVEKLERFAEVDLAKLNHAKKPDIQVHPWSSLIQAGRSGHSPFEKMTEEDVSAFNPGDLRWHRRTVRVLTGSSFGFWITPSFAMMLAASWCITAVHIGSYACSQGELTNIELVTSSILQFQPWQHKYQVTVDASFRQVAMLATADATSTRRIAFEQPSSAPGAKGYVSNHTVEKTFSGAVEEIHLSKHVVPRIATVAVQGLRSSMDLTQYKIRLSPLVTLPVLLTLKAGDFTKSVSWSTLPGSILSVPAGSKEFELKVFLADFEVGIPEAWTSTPSDATFWTGFQPSEHPTDSHCAEACRHNPRCFSQYLGHHGCFYILGKHRSLEEGHVPTVHSKGDRNLTGRLAGCQLHEDSDGTLLAEGGETLTFQSVFPDWGSASAELNFALHMAVGEQSHDSASIVIQLQKGPPSLTDALGVLLGRVNGEDIVLNSTTWVDGAGSLMVKIFEYNPRNVQSLHLLLLPILPDQDFHIFADGLPDAAERDIVEMRHHPRCLASPHIRGRYKVCNDTGYLEDRPLKIPLDAWTGHPQETLKLQTVPRSPSKWWTNATQTLTILFDGVDSPVAWAAHQTGCGLLTEARRALAASASATCKVLQQNCTQDICHLLDNDGLGGRWLYAMDAKDQPPPLLNPSAIMEVVSCQQEPCGRKYRWSYNRGVLGLVNHSSQLRLSDALMKATKAQGLTLLTSINASLEEEEASHFVKDVTTEVWKIPIASPDLLLTLASFSTKNMLRNLLESWIRSSAALPDGAEVFQKVKGSLSISLTDSLQLQRLPLLLSMAPNVMQLVVNCAGCPAVQATWPSWLQAWQVRRLVLEHFHLHTLPHDAFHDLSGLKKLDLSKNHLEMLPKEIFQNLIGLKELLLLRNQLKTLPKEIFQNLTGLKQLYLGSNHLETLPAEIFQNVTGLEVLRLGGNHLETLPKEIFQNLPGLEVLRLGDNHLKTLPNEIFQNLPRLKKLTLNSNHLETLPKAIFQNLTELKQLYLNDNHLKTLPQEIFQNLTGLKRLYLNGNHLKTLPAEIFQNLTGLKRLYLNGNRLETMPKEIFQNLAGLKWLVLDGNPGLERPGVCNDNPTIHCRGP